MNLIETVERINSWNEMKNMYEYVDTSRYNQYRCVACDFEEVVK